MTKAIDTAINVRPKDVPFYLQTAKRAGRSVIITGPPGTAKTTMALGFGEVAGLTPVLFHAALMDLVDLSGIPNINDQGQTAFHPPARWPNEPGSLIVLDDFTQAQPALMVGFSSLLNMGYCGDYKLPEGSMVIATGNRVEDRASSYSIPSHVGSRALRLEIEADPQDWLNWAKDNGIYRPIIAYGRWKPSQIYQFDPAQPGHAQGKFPNFRTWHMLSDLLIACQEPPTPQQLLVLANGLIGEAVARDFAAFSSLFSKIPNPDLILKKPDTAPVPKTKDGSPDYGAIYATVCALIDRVSDKNVENFLTYLLRLPTEPGVMGGQLLYSQDRKLITNATNFRDWAVANKNVIL